MQYRCPKCKQIYDGVVDACPHCGEKQYYFKDAEPEVVFKNVDLGGKLAPLKRVKGQVFMLNITFVLSAFVVLLAALFTLFVPMNKIFSFVDLVSTPFKINPTLPVPVIFSYPLTMKFLIDFLNHPSDANISWFVLISAAFDSFIFFYGLIVAFVSGYALCKGIVSTVLNEPVPFLNPIKGKPKRFGFIGFMLSMFFTETIFVFVKALIYGFFSPLHAFKFIIKGNYTYFPTVIALPVMMLLFIGSLLILHIVNESIRKSLKVVD